MIALFAALVLAEDLERVWVGPDARTVDGWAAQNCTAPRGEGLELPAGMPARAKPLRPTCGGDWLVLEFDGPMGDRAHPYPAVVHPSAVVRRPPPNAWERSAVQGVGFVARGSITQGPAYGVLLDEPSAGSTYPLPDGEPVEILDPRYAVVRTQSGRELVLAAGWIEAEDPLLKKNERQRRALVDRLAAGRARWEERGTLVPAPASDELLRAKAGRAYELMFRVPWLSAPRFDPAWFDPVGHLVENTCDERRERAEPCGRYWLDWSAFGAHRPQSDETVLAVHEGSERVDGVEVPRLRVLVIEPWREEIGVARGWYEVER